MKVSNRITKTIPDKTNLVDDILLEHNRPLELHSNGNQTRNDFLQFFIALVPRIGIRNNGAIDSPDLARCGGKTVSLIVA